ncbi:MULTISPECIES: hypothetical protein [Streptomyces]|uniref:hypothetical protein n=1 Tax=Streptomyces TaxID=1883 RepID=UPI00117DB3FF|nr:hypothetical protein [Streptomyces kasugaensis]
MTATTDARRNRAGWPAGQVALGAAPWLVAAVVPWAVLLVLRDRMPAEVVSHTGWDGPNGFMAAPNFVAIVTLAFLFQGAVFVPALIKGAQTNGQYLLTAAVCWGFAAGEAYLLAVDLHADARGSGLNHAQLLEAYNINWALHAPVTAVLAVVTGAAGVLMARKAVRR